MPEFNKAQFLQDCAVHGIVPEFIHRHDGSIRRIAIWEKFPVEILYSIPNECTIGSDDCWVYIEFPLPPEKPVADQTP